MPTTPALTNRGHVLEEAERRQICQWYAEFRTPTEIHGLVKKEFNKTVSVKTIWEYANHPKWKPYIERLRQEWALGVMDLPLAHKRGRLEKFISLLERAERNDKVTEYARITQCASILSEIREEMEAGKAQFTTLYMTTIHNYSDAELIRRRDEVRNRLKQTGGKNGLRSKEPQAGDGPSRPQETIDIDPTGGPEPATSADSPAAEGSSGGGIHQRLDGGSNPETPPPAGAPIT